MLIYFLSSFFFFSSRRRHTRLQGDWSSDVCSSDLERADAATIARLRAELRLDDPLPARFGHYVWGIVRGDLGRSYITARPIAQDLKERFPKTAELALAAMTLAALAGITLGVVSAVRPGGAFDRIAMLLSYLGVSFPVYWVGLLLILVFEVALRWLPPSGSGGLAYLVPPALP